MAAFRICLMGQHQPLLVDLAADNIRELVEEAAHNRFLTGHMVEPNEDGLCLAVMIQTNRIQAAFEAG